VAKTFAGLLIYVTSPFSVGDFIQTDQVLGTVEKIGWTYTVIRANNGLVVNLPNTSLSESLTKNWDKTEKLQILVVAKDFEGLTMIKQHRLVNTVAKDELAKVHAFNVKTYSPAKWAARSK